MLDCQHVLFVNPHQLLNWQTLLFWWLHFNTWTLSPRVPSVPRKSVNLFQWRHFPTLTTPEISQMLVPTSLRKLMMLWFSSVTQSCPTLCDPMDCSMPGFPVHYQLLKLAQAHVHRVSDATQPSHPLSSPSPPAFNLSQHQDLFQWVSSSHQVARVLELQLKHQSFQWISRTDFP